MSQKYFKVGAIAGHCGSGRGFEIMVSVAAKNITEAAREAKKIGGIKKRHDRFWSIEEIDRPEYMAMQRRWTECRGRMREIAV